MTFPRQQFIQANENNYYLRSKQKQQINLYSYDTIPSTNEKVWQLIDENKQLPIAAIATQQTAGRGQWGRKWLSKPGGLYLSVGIETAIELNNAFHLTMATALGIADNLRDNNIPVLLKWPNDLILEGKKLGGIKIETRQQQEKITRAVVGVGINWDNIVPEVGINLKSYRDRIASLEMLAAITVTGILAGYQNYLETGIEQILRSYLEISDSIGRKVTLKGIPGTVIGITDRGQLRISLSSPGATTEILLRSGQISLGY